MSRATPSQPKSGRLETENYRSSYNQSENDSNRGNYADIRSRSNSRSISASRHSNARSRSVRSLSRSQSRHRSRSKSSVSRSQSRERRSPSRSNLRGSDLFDGLRSDVKYLVGLVKKFSQRQIEQERRMNRIEVSINKTFIMVGDMTNTHNNMHVQPNGQLINRQMDIQSETDMVGFERFDVPKLPIVDVNELLALQKQLKNREFKRFLVSTVLSVSQFLIVSWDFVLTISSLLFFYFNNSNLVSNLKYICQIFIQQILKYYIFDCGPIPTNSRNFDFNK